METLSADSAITAAENDPLRDVKRKNAIKGAFFSEFIDMFDIYLPVIVLPPVLFYFQPPNLSSSTANILASLVFITTLLGRPIGALLFGIMADRIGRRMASIYSVSGFGVVTFLIALIPGYETLGIASYLLLVLLRFIDGIFLGGGYTGAIPLALEYSKKEQRGFVGGLILSGFPAAYVAINLVAMLMFALIPLDGLYSPYAQGGWRIPFVIGGLLAGFLALYYVFNVTESEVWQQGSSKKRAREKQPLSTLVSGQSGRNLWQVLLMMSGFWLTQNLITLFLPTGLLINTLNMRGLQVTSILLVTYCVLFFSYIGMGMLGQKIGRRRFFMIAGPLIATMGSALLYVLSHGDGLSFSTVMLLVCLLAVVVTSPWGVIITYINEHFATGVRATGFGVGFSLSVIIPSFYAFYMDWLSVVVPFELTAVVLLALGGMIGTVGAIMGPETKEVDFTSSAG
ncbi:MFS transporter [Yersinia pestis subsp. microtus bv. Altaica]|nr:MFS transporter [Yersinia pestis]OML14366.1 MFS transporter [Yersinia pestis subsp. microtus bv. Altaica]